MFIQNMQKKIEKLSLQSDFSTCYIQFDLSMSFMTIADGHTGEMLLRPNTSTYR